METGRGDASRRRRGDSAETGSSETGENSARPLLLVEDLAVALDLEEIRDHEVLLVGHEAI